MAQGSWVQPWLGETIWGSINAKFSHQWHENPGVWGKFLKHQILSENPKLSQQYSHAGTLYLTLKSHSECPEMFYVVGFNCSEVGNIVIKTQRTCTLVWDTKAEPGALGKWRGGIYAGTVLQFSFWLLLLLCMEWLQDHLVIHGIFNNDNLSGLFM